MLVNKYGLGLQELVASSNKRYLSSLRASSELVGAELDRANFQPPITFRHSGNKGVMDKKIQYDANNANIKGLVKYLKAPDRRLILRAKNTSSWMTVRSTMVTITVLGATEFCDFLCTHYDFPPP